MFTFLVIDKGRTDIDPWEKKWGLRLDPEIEAPV